MATRTVYKNHVTETNTEIAEDVNEAENNSRLVDAMIETFTPDNMPDGFVRTDDVIKDMCGIIESSRKAAYKAVNAALVQRNWLLGYRIASEELQGKVRAEYGDELVKKISVHLTKAYGRGFDYSSLYKYVRFYREFPKILDSLSPKSQSQLSWTHYRTLLQVNDKAARDWYEKEAIEQTWSIRTLQRNISSQYYYRMLKTQKKELVEMEMKELTASYQ